MNSAPKDHPTDRSIKYLFSGKLANSKYLPNAARYNYHNRVRAFVDADGTLALRERWLSHWNPYHDPAKLACVTAVDNAWYACAAVPQIAKQFYETGDLTGCRKAYQELTACFRIKFKANAQPAQAMRELDAIDPLEHVYTTATAVTPATFQRHALVRGADAASAVAATAPLVPASAATAADVKAAAAAAAAPAAAAESGGVAGGSTGSGAFVQTHAGSFGLPVMRRERGDGIWEMRAHPPARFQYDLLPSAMYPVVDTSVLPSDTAAGAGAGAAAIPKPPAPQYSAADAMSLARAMAAAKPVAPAASLCRFQPPAHV